MARRHFEGEDLQSKIRRCQELIMARSGADDFYEIVRLLLAKHFSEEQEQKPHLTARSVSALLTSNKETVERFVEGGASLDSPPEVITECLRILNNVRIHDQSYEVLDAAFEFLTSRHYKSDKGQFFTPRSVVDMCVRALAPQPGELICDPACGSGAFLKQAFDYLKLSKDRKVAGLYGFDISARASKTSALMSYLAANDVIRVEQLDSLNLKAAGFLQVESPSIEQYMQKLNPEFHGFDVILTNPPFAGDVSTHDFLIDYELSSVFGGKVERDVLFVERCLSLLTDGGRMAIVVPDNKVSGKRFAEFRSWLLSRTEVVAVVSLHPHTFRPHTSQKAAVLIIKKATPNLSRRIALYRSEECGKSASGDPIYSDAAKRILQQDLTEIGDDLHLETVA